MASRNYTFRVWFEEGDPQAMRELIAELGGMGCLVETYSARLMALSCPEDAAEAALPHGELEERFVYESGRQITR